MPIISQFSNLLHGLLLRGLLRSFYKVVQRLFIPFYSGSDYFFFFPGWNPWMNLFWTTKLVSDITSSIYNLLQCVMFFKFWKFSGKFRFSFTFSLKHEFPPLDRILMILQVFSGCKARTWLSVHFLDSESLGVRDLEPRWTPVYKYNTSNLSLFQKFRCLFNQICCDLVIDIGLHC